MCVDGYVYIYTVFMHASHTHLCLCAQIQVECCNELQQYEESDPEDHIVGCATVRNVYIHEREIYGQTSSKDTVERYTTRVKPRPV